jgi:hypothetical protein
MPPRTRRLAYARGRPGMPRRRTIWIRTESGQQTLASATQTGFDLLTAGRIAGIGLVGCTVLRTHCSANFRTLDTDTRPSVTLGFIVYDQVQWQPATIPAVLTEFNLDWSLRHYLTPGTSPSAVLDPANAPTGTIWGRDYDIRSRRRIHEIGDTYLLMLYNNGSATVTYSLSTAVLVALA